ncbi:MAG: PAS domain-containing protein, partial [Opitutales bacterium]|nr:PAS domain-containing protein [Opitutales bacterium]
MNFKDDKIAQIIRANKRLSREASRMESVFQAIREGVMLSDREGNILYINDSAKKILGAPEDAQFLTVPKILPQIDAIELRAVCEGAASQREFEIAYPERRFIKVYMARTNSEDEEIAIIVSDMTSEKISARDRIESEKIASVLKLASGVAHELGNPINSISIHLQLALRSLAKMRENRQLEKVGQSVEVCLQEVSRLDGIIKNFLKALRPAR